MEIYVLNVKILFWKCIDDKFSFSLNTQFKIRFRCSARQLVFSVISTIFQIYFNNFQITFIRITILPRRIRIWSCMKVAVAVAEPKLKLQKGFVCICALNVL